MPVRDRLAGRQVRRVRPVLELPLADQGRVRGAEPVHLCHRRQQVLQQGVHQWYERLTLSTMSGQFFIYFSFSGPKLSPKAECSNPCEKNAEVESHFEVPIVGKLIYKCRWGDDCQVMSLASRYLYTVVTMREQSFSHSGEGSEGQGRQPHPLPRQHEVDGDRAARLVQVRGSRVLLPCEAGTSSRIGKLNTGPLIGT